MAATNYIILMRRTDDTNYVVTREGIDQVMHDSASGLALDAALDLFKTWVLANGSPERIQANVSGLP